VLHQKNELLLQKGKRRGLIKRSYLLKRTMDEQLEQILLKEDEEAEEERKKSEAR
jgi:hypothetical protein